MTIDPSVVKADVAAGRLCCPGCGGRLLASEYARERDGRVLQGVRVLRRRDTRNAAAARPTSCCRRGSSRADAMARR
jgi:hypothetical protein